MGSSSSSSGKKFATADASTSVKPERSMTPPLPAFTPEETLTYAIRKYRFTGAPRPTLPYMHGTNKNFDILRELDELLVPYLGTSKNVVDTHILMYCGVAAACELAGLKIIPTVIPTLQALKYDPWQISEKHSRGKLGWPPIGERVFLRGEYYYYGNVICSVHHQFTGTRTNLKYYMRHYDWLEELRFEGTTFTENEVEPNSPNLRPVFDLKVRPKRSLMLCNAGWQALSDSSIWMELGIIQNSFQSPFWFCPSLSLVANLLSISGKGQNLRCEAEIILHLLPEDASYKLLAVEKGKDFFIVILKIIQYFTDGLEENFSVEKCAVVQVHIKISRSSSNLRLFTKKTLRSIGIKEAYRCFNTRNTRITKSLDDQEPVNCRVIYDPEKDRSLMFCRPKKEMALNEKRVRELERYFMMHGPKKNMDAIQSAK